MFRSFRCIYMLSAIFIYLSILLANWYYSMYFLYTYPYPYKPPSDYTHPLSCRQGPIDTAGNYGQYIFSLFNHHSNLIRTNSIPNFIPFSFDHSKGFMIHEVFWLLNIIRGNKNSVRNHTDQYPLCMHYWLLMLNYTQKIIKILRNIALLTCTYWVL